VADDKPGVDRRSVLIGLGGLVTGAAVGVTGWAGIEGAVTSGVAPTAAPALAPEPARVEASGDQQAGIHRPSTPQRQGLLFALDLDSTDLAWLPAIGEAILDLVEGGNSASLPEGPGDLTVTVGLGPRLIAAVDPTLPGGEELPAFKGDENITDDRRGGDVLLAAYSSDPTVLRGVLESLSAAVPGSTLRWEQRGFRGPGTGGVVRNPLGFLDGIIVPHTDDELDRNVWIADGPLAGGTICVLRRLRLDIAAFHERTRQQQEAVFGRRFGDGAPLSGGGTLDQIDLRAKTPEGDYVVPADAHARAAHPSFTGSELMLRRGYAFDDGLDDTGLLFVCFQRTLRTFVATQQRLDDVDALSKFVTPTGSATFVMLPGFDRGTPLGATLVG
jgi:dye decolorizing peroxidase